MTTPQPNTPPNIPETATPSDELRHKLGELMLADNRGEVPSEPSEINLLDVRFARWSIPVINDEHRGFEVEPMVEHIRSIREKALDGGNQSVAINGTLQMIEKLRLKEYTSSFTNKPDLLQDPSHSYYARRSGANSYRVRRTLARLMGVRPPEEYIEEERGASLRAVSAIANFEQYLTPLVAHDTELKQAADSHQPGALRTRLDKLAQAGLLKETNPLHPRWSAVMDPANVKALRTYLINYSSNFDVDSQNMALRIDGAGISGLVEPHVVAAYLGISYADWDKQRFGQQSWSKPEDAPKAGSIIPKEVVEQINYLIKLDGAVVDVATNPDGTPALNQDGSKKTISALDKVVEYGGAKPWTTSPDPTAPMKRILANEKALIKDARDDAIMERAKPLLIQFDGLNRLMMNLDEKDDAYNDLKRQRRTIKARLTILGIYLPTDNIADAKVGPPPPKSPTP